MATLYQHLEGRRAVSDLDCLIAIPCYRESERLPPFLEGLCRALATAPFSSHIVVVDDGSGDSAAQELRSKVSLVTGNFLMISVECMLLEQNRGKGGAVYAGWQSASAASAELLCFVDADGSVPPAEVVRIIGDLRADTVGRWDAFYGSRVKMLGYKVERLASRHYVGRVFATLVTAITGLTVYDSQCGLKVVRRSAYQSIATSLRETRFVFDVELTLHLLLGGFHIREVPIDWSEVGGSKVHLLRDSVRMLLGLIRIRGRLAERSRPINQDPASAAVE